MSKITNIFLHLLPENWQQKVRNKYYENKISKVLSTEEPDLFVVKAIIKEGQTVVDIGANFGMYTRFLSEYTGNSGKVISFEPIKRSFLSLRHNVNFLQLQNVDVYQFALSDEEKMVKMEIPDYNEGGENLYEARISKDTGGKNVEMVKTKILDKVLANRKIHFIKIDVEGHELNVLKGALEILEKQKPVLLVEINGGIKAGNENARQIAELLLQFGYRPFRRFDQRLRRIEGDDDGFNYFFLNADHENQHREIISPR